MSRLYLWDPYPHRGPGIWKALPVTPAVPATSAAAEPVCAAVQGNFEGSTIATNGPSQRKYVRVEHRLTREVRWVPVDAFRVGGEVLALAFYDTDAHFVPVE